MKEYEKRGTEEGTEEEQYGERKEGRKGERGSIQKE